MIFKAISNPPYAKTGGGQIVNFLNAITFKK